MTLSSVIQGWVEEVARSEINQVNVINFGAVPDGATDCTAAFQEAALAAGINGEVIIPAGEYILSATIQGLKNQSWLGVGHNSTRLLRSGNYGDTLSFNDGYACSVKGIFFRHGTQYENANPAPLDNIANGGTAHVRLKGAQGARIENCWMWRMPYGVVIEDGSLINIHDCNMQGTWDHTLPNRQEGIASVLIGNSGYTQIVSIDKCYFGGSLSEARDVIFTSTDTGAHTFNYRQNIGSKNGVRVMQCEDLCISNSYFGNHNASNLATALVSGSVNLDWRFTGNFFDAARDGAGVNFRTASDDAYVNGVTITGNVFNGEMQTNQAIAMYNPLGINPVVTNFSVTGNTFQAFIGTPMLIYHARGGNISSNTVTGYNALGISAGADYTYSAGIYFSEKASHIVCCNNILGGAINTSTPSAYCYFGVKLDAALPLPATILNNNNLLIA